MGYTTQFQGQLTFKTELVGKDFAHLKTILGEDCRDHTEWEAPGLYYIDLELNDDFSGLRWGGQEKTYEMEKLVEVVIKQMKKVKSDFALDGILLAQGEDLEDRWQLIVKDNVVTKKMLTINGEILECPECGHRFEKE